MDKLELLEKKTKDAIDLINRLKEEKAALQAALREKTNNLELLEKKQYETKKITDDYRRIITVHQEIKQKLRVLLEKIEKHIKKGS